MLHPSSHTGHNVSYAPENIPKEGIHLHAVAATAIHHNLLEQIFGMQGQRSCGRVVQSDTVKRYSGKMMLLKQFEAQQGQHGMLLGARAFEI